MHTQKRTGLKIASIVVLFLGIISYLLADRYLIQHVEIADVSAYAGRLPRPPCR